MKLVAAILFQQGAHSGCINPAVEPPYQIEGNMDPDHKN
jgi:hypothetical protein